MAVLADARAVTADAPAAEAARHKLADRARHAHICYDPRHVRRRA